MNYKFHDNQFIFFRVSGMCKHIAALLYFVANEVSKGKNLACTSTKQVWHQPTQKKLKTSAMLSNIKTPKASNRVCPEEKPKRHNFDPRPIHLRQKKSLADFDLDELSEISNGKAAVLLYSDNFRQNIPSHVPVFPDISLLAQEEEIKTAVSVPPIFSSFQASACKDSENFLSHLKFNKLGREQLETSTRTQFQSEIWREQRKGRMTASVMHQIIKHITEGNIIGEISSVVGNVMGYNNDFTAKATTHGLQGEPIVRKRYIANQRKVHKGLSVTLSGLWVFQEFPLLAASPDGIVRCECCPTARVLEIKCPYKDRKLTIHEYAEQGTSTTEAQHQTVVIVKDGALQINTNHPFYTQVQAQMLCTGLLSCDLVIGTEAPQDNFCIFTIQKDDPFCTVLKTKAKVFYHKVIFPELQSRMYFNKKKCCT